MRTHVDLFSGIGGFSLACEWAGVETIAFSEVDPYASRVLQRYWPNVRNYGDVREFPSLSAWLLTAGVPCQPASAAGKRKGAADDRWLWPETLAVVENGSYEWLLFENPTGILSLNDGLEFERICASLESQGYEVQPLVIPACAVGAKHRRDRIWIVAHRNREHVERGQGSRGVCLCGAKGSKRADDHACRSGADATDSERRGRREPMRSDTASGTLLTTIGKESASRLRPSGAHDGNAASERLPNWTGGTLGQPFPLTELERSGGREVERDFRGVAYGVSARVDRLRCLGNAIVPQVAYQLIKRMIEAES